MDPTIGIISHPICRLHDMGMGHPECPERIDAINLALKNADFFPKLRFLKAVAVSEADLNLAHTADYIQSLYQHSPRDGAYQIDPDTSMNPSTLKAALLAAGSPILGIDRIMQGEFKQVFCNIRPPGHHAERARAMGFCFFNNIAIAALYALEAYGLKRVAIIDFDVHHGNGTEDILKDNPKILFCSSYQHPFYPFSPVVQNSNNIMHLPLPAGSEGDLFRKGVQDQWLPRLRQFSPDLILISAGFDAHYLDPISSLNFTEQDYYWITQEIVQIANECCQGRIISSLEGGYYLPALASSIVAHVSAFLL